MSSFTEDREIKHIALIVAMEAEGHPLIEHLGLQKISNSSPFAPCVVYQGDFEGGKVSVVLSGKDGRFGVDNVGTVPAAIATFVAVNDLRPDVLISAGTAGGYTRGGAAIGDCFIGTHFVHHDRRIPIPGFDAYGIGARDGVECPNLIKSLNYKSGIVTSGNSLDCCDVDAEFISKSNAVVKEMEAASIAWVAEYSKTPFFAVKVITDIVDGGRPTHEEFLENLSVASKNLQEQLPKVLSFVINKKYSEL